jgi:preprotein translocase subunit SecA
MNRQREAIYSDRRHILEGDDITDRVATFLEDAISTIVHQHVSDVAGAWDLEALWTELRAVYPIELQVHEVLAEAGARNKLSADWLAREITSDAKLAYQKRTNEIGDEAMRELERRVVLSVIDRKWRDHLYEMDYLKEGIGLRAMAQRDPLVEYQREGFALYQQMMGAIKEETAGFLFNLQVEVDRKSDHVEIGAAGLEAPSTPGYYTYSAPSEDGDAEVHPGATGRAPQAPQQPKPAPKRDNGQGSSFFRH